MLKNKKLLVDYKKLSNDIIFEDQRKFLLQNALFELKIFIKKDQSKKLKISSTKFIKIFLIYQNFSNFKKIIQFFQTITSGLVFLVFIADFIFQVNKSVFSALNYSISLLISLSCFGFILTILWFIFVFICKKYRKMALDVLETNK